MSETRLGSLTIRNTSNLINPDTRFCALIYGPAKFGKTLLASGLDAVTRKYRGKPTLYVALEAAEGGGTMTLQNMNIDFVMPKNWDEMESLLSTLSTDKTYGGVVVDNGTDYIVRIVRPYALKFPAKEKFMGARAIGVPVRSDYQTMAEAARGQLNKLINLTNENTPPDYRKDLIVTALEREKTDDDGNLVSITPAFPGALADVASAMFQDVVRIRIKQKVVPTKEDPKVTRRISTRYLHVTGDGVAISDSRSGMFRHDWPLTTDDGQATGLLELYESWLKSSVKSEEVS